MIEATGKKFDEGSANKEKWEWHYPYNTNYIGDLKDFITHQIPETGEEKMPDQILIKNINCDERKKNIVKYTLERLPDWFAIPEAVEKYISDSSGKPFFCAFDGDNSVGFLYLKETGRHTVELAVMGVLREYHRRGIGRKLFEVAAEKAREMGYSFMQVKTVQMGRYDVYDETNRFYLSLGFKELEVFPTLWDVRNPCQIYIMSIDRQENS